MTVRVTCPACGCRADIEAFLVEDEAKRMAARFAPMDPALGRLVLQYLRLFKPAKQELRAARAARIVDELMSMIEVGTVCRDERAGQRRPAPTAVWVEALEQMLAKPPSETPLGNHHYLRAVAWGVAGEHQAKHPGGTQTSVAPPGIRSGGISPERPVDPVAVQIEWLADQLRYGQMTREEHDARVAKLRGAA